MCATDVAPYEMFLDDPLTAGQMFYKHSGILSTFNFDGKVLRKEFLGLFHLEAVVVVIIYTYRQSGTEFRFIDAH